jgi:flagellar FliJ protein
MAFRFPLAPVLRYRRSLERSAELSLQRVAFEIAQTKSKIEQLTAEIAQAEAERDQILRQSITCFELQSMLSEATLALEHKRALLDSLVALEERRKQQMLAYQAALRDRRVLSDLAARLREEYELESSRAQQKQIDDVFGARAFRR